MNEHHLSVKKEPGRSPRAIVRIYGEETIDAMNQIAEVLNKRPALIFQDWIAQVHAQMVDEGQIKL